MSLYKQLLAGLNATDAEIVTLAEHDCLYTNEYLSWMPPDKGTFYYNYNCWLVQWGGNHPEMNGMYSYRPSRIALSQLTCGREILKASMQERITLLEDGYILTKGHRGVGEPGVIDDVALRKALTIAMSGKSHQIQQYIGGALTKYPMVIRNSILPNVDIRHSTNFTGPKRGKKRRYELPYWGSFDNLMKGVMV
jgi:hypothetical protein